MPLLPATQKTAAGTYMTGVTLSSAGNTPFSFAGRINTIPLGSGFYGSYIGLDLSAIDTITRGAITWSLTNSGSITSGQYGVIFRGAGTFRNTGVANGTTGTGVGFVQPGTLINSGTLAGQLGADLKAGGSVTNSGVLGFGASTGLQIRSGAAAVGNSGAGVITGQHNGVVVFAGAGVTITNAATIRSTGSSASSDQKYYGIQSLSAASVTNAAGGLISSSGVGVAVQSAAGTVVNGGTLTGLLNSVKFAAGFANRLVAQPTGVFNGNADGGNAPGATTASVLELAAGAGAGTLTGIGTKFVNFSSITVDAGAAWVLGAASAVTPAYSLSDGGTLTNLGSITGPAGSGAGVTMQASGSLLNGGQISGGVRAVDAPNGGFISNLLAGTITFGNLVGIRSAGGGTVVNAGLITSGDIGQGSAGVLLTAGGTVTNQATGTISSLYNPINGAGAAVTVVNRGTIVATGAAAAGVPLSGGGTISNLTGGQITGGVGVYLTTVGATVSDAGVITGTTGAGVRVTGGGTVTALTGGTISGATYGVSVSGVAGTVVNRGTISGANGTAVAFGSGLANRVQVFPTSVFNGIVKGGGNASVVALSSAASIGTISGIGTQFVNFGTVALDNLATWAVSGSVAGGTKLAFLPGGAGTMIFNTPSTMAGTITGFGEADFIALIGVSTAALGGTLSAGKTLSIAQINGQTLTLAFDDSRSKTPAIVNTANGRSYQYDYNPNGQAVENATEYGGPNGTGTLVSLTVSKTNGVDGVFSFVTGSNFTGINFGATTGTSLFYAYNPSSTVTLTVSQYTAPRATGTKVSDVVDGNDGTSLIYAYNPSGTVKLTAQKWSGTDPSSGAPMGSKLSTVVDNNDGTSLVYAYNPNGTVTLTVQTWSGTDPSNGAPAGTKISDVVDNADGTVLVYAYNPASTIAKTAILYSATDASNGAPAGRQLSKVFDYNNGQSAITVFNVNGTSGTAFYSLWDGAGVPISGISGALVATSSALISAANASIGGPYPDPRVEVIDAAGSASYGYGSSVDPGAGDYAIRFLAGTANETVVLHQGGVNTITGFDAGAGDRLSVRALIAEANIDPARLHSYLSVEPDNGAVSVRFDPSGHGGGSVVAVLVEGGGVSGLADPFKLFSD